MEAVHTFVDTSGGFEQPSLNGSHQSCSCCGNMEQSSLPRPTSHLPNHMENANRRVVVYLDGRQSLRSLGTSGEDDHQKVFAPPCTCFRCKQQFRTEEQQEKPKCRHWVYSSSISDNQAKIVLRELVQEINDHRSYVTDRIRTHGNTIINRWCHKKSQIKRAECLQSTLPGIFTGKMPRELFTRPCSSEEQPGYFLLYLNVLELSSNSKNLIHLLHYRTTNSPADWAWFDNAQLTREWEVGSLPVFFNEHNVVMRADSYGELKHWDAVAAHRDSLIGFPRAKLVLEAQAKLMRFLRNIVDSILQGIRSDNPSGNSRWPNSSDLRQEIATRRAPCAVLMSQPYSKPPLPDLDTITEIARTGEKAAEVHLWKLQTDPEYAKIHIRALNDLFDGMHIHSPEQYGYTAVRIFLGSMDYFSDWTWIASDCHEILHQYKELYHQGRAGQKLPYQLYKSVNFLVERLEEALCEHCENLQQSLRHTITFMDRYERDRSRDIPDYCIGYRLKCESANPESRDYKALYSLWESDRLHYCLLRLCCDPTKCFEVTKADAFKFVESYMASKPQAERGRITPEMEVTLSNLAPLCELQALLHYSLPQLMPLDNHGNDGTMTLGLHNERGRFSRAECNYEITELERKRLGKLLCRFDSLPQPSGEKDKSWIDQDEALYTQLGSFWVEAERVMRRIYESDREGTLEKGDIDRWLSYLKFNRDPKHVAERNKKPDAILNPKPKRKRKPKPEPEQHTPLEEWVVPTELKVDGQKEKIPAEAVPDGKTNTRPVTQQPEPPAEALAQPRHHDENIKAKPNETPNEQSPEPCEAGEQGEEDEPGEEDESGKQDEQDEPQKPILPQPAIAVKARSLTVLLRLFSGPLHGAKSKTVRWQDFVAAMADAGYLATNGAGSSVTFSQSPQRTIVFHQPHPDGKIHDMRLLHWGRRLNKKFGWQKDTFVERPRA